jgi:hypothetical protein
MSNATLEYIINKYKAQFVPGTKQPIEIQGMFRTDLAQDFAELGFKSGAEIGVREGHFSRHLCKTNKQLTLYSIDPYQTYTGYRDYLEQERLDGFYEAAKQRLAPYKCTLIRKTSMEALKDFDNNSLDFVYIDGNHEVPWIVDDICWWSTKVRVGGIVAGDDYFISKHHVRTQIHVKYAVDAIARALYVDPYFMIGASADMENILAAQQRPAWFWIKTEKQWTIWGTSSTNTISR